MMLHMQLCRRTLDWFSQHVKRRLKRLLDR
jgi:hypothetical protein